MPADQIAAIKAANANIEAAEAAYKVAYDGFNNSVLSRTPFQFDNPLGWGIAAALGITTRVAARERD
jgi:hypothetical protein